MGENFKKVILWGIVFFLFLGSVVGLAQLSSNATQTTDEFISSDTNYSDDWAMGNPNAKAILVEYADFQCPSCARLHPVLKSVVDSKKDSVLFVSRFFPLPMHQQAELASKSAHAAGLQGKYFEYADMLFSKQTEWSEKDTASSIMETYAQSLGLNMDQFKKDRDSNETLERIKADVKSGSENSVNATPTLFLNGKKITIPSDASELEKLIDEANK